MKHVPIRTQAAPDALAPNLVQRAETELAFLELRRRRLPIARLSEAHWTILLDVYVGYAHGRPIQTTALAEEAGVNRTTLMRHLNGLEDLELVRRVDDADDARVTRIEPTDRGLECVAAILDEAAEIERGRSRPGSRVSAAR